MSQSFPQRCNRCTTHTKEEQTLQDYSEVLKIIAVDINAGDAAYHAASCDKYHPIPLPSPSDDPEPLVLTQVECSMLLQVDQCEHDADSKQCSEDGTQSATRLQRKDWHVTVGCIHKRAIGKQYRLELVKDEIAGTVVGQCFVAVQRVIPVFEGRLVESYAVDDGLVDRVAIGGEGHQVSQVDETHCDVWSKPHKIKVRSLEGNGNGR
jgi:hypothetical protein